MERPKQLSQRPIRSIGGVLLVAAASLALAWAANEKAADEKKDERRPDARAVLMKMADCLSKSPAWSVIMHTSYDAVQSDGYKVEWNDIRNVTLKRPNGLRVEVERSDGARSLVLFDGKTITGFDENGRVYAQQAHPGTVDDAVMYFVHDLGMRLPLAVVLLDRLPAELQQRVRFIKYVEKTATLGEPTDHIAAKTATVDFQVWIAEGDRPLPMRVVLTYKNTRGQPQFRAEFSDWKLDIQPSDSLFAFTPPAGAKQIPFVATLARIAPARRQGSAARVKEGKQ